MLIALENLTEGLNVRTVPILPLAEKSLERSVAASGVLQPILVRPIPGTRRDPNPGTAKGFEVVLGTRRVRAARAAGLTEIPAEARDMTNAEVRRAQLAENMIRVNMHPADQWRAVHEIMQDGISAADAANALGLDDRAVRRMERLGRLNPYLLKLVEIQMPNDHQLRVIANASAKQQQAIAKRSDVLFQRGGTETVDWNVVAQACVVERISRDVAIFDPATTKIVWDEDLFAPADDPLFTTVEIDKFMVAQRKALEAQVAALVKAKKKARLSQIGNHGMVELPKGFTRVYDSTLEKMRKRETAFLAIGLDGGIVTVIAQEEAPKKTAAKTGGKGNGDARPEIDDEADEGIDDGPVVTEILDKSPITKAGLGLIAMARQAAVRRALEEPMSCLNVIALLVMALCADNVSVQSDSDAEYGRFNDLAQRMLHPTGNPIALSEADLIQIGQTAVGRIVQFRGPDTLRYLTSGVAGEWIGNSINAQMHLPRFDTAEFLATVNGTELRRIAQARQAEGFIIAGTPSVKALRAALVGNAPNYRPEAAVFGAPAPKAR